SKDGGTGGGIFRKLYGEFLLEADQLIPDRGLTAVGTEFIKLADEWDAVAEELWTLGNTGNAEMLPALSEQLSTLASTERNLLEQLEALVTETHKTQKS
ncbi:MAG: DUF4872 domain-containing protein, partial [Enterococcus hulanensis]